MGISLLGGDNPVFMYIYIAVFARLSWENPCMCTWTNARLSDHGVRTFLMKDFNTNYSTQ